VKHTIAMILLILLPNLASANPVQVQSGEHDGFTRLVLDYGQTVGWQLGRSPDGYELQVLSPTAYDFTQAFNLIGKGRLAAIWADPASGNLRIGIACACHAIPFEFRPGIVVIDLRDGPPPKGSSFELALNGDPSPELPKRNLPRPRPRPALATPYDWLKRAVADPARPAHHQPYPHLLGEIDPTLQPLREALLHQLSRGVAQGVVDIAIPQASPNPGNGSGNPSVQIHVGDLPGMTADIADSDKSLAANGNTCPTASNLDVSGWGDDHPISQQIALSRQGLVQEFDKPDPEALARAVKFHLFMGFGAEARQLLQAFPVDQKDAPFWRSLSFLMDDEPDSAPAFAGLEACDTPAAMWALLGNPAPVAGGALNNDAALLAFSALPVHLRQLLGPRMAERFLAREDAESARAVRDAILRAPGTAGAATDLLQAEMDMKSGDPKAAEAKLVNILADSGPHATEALITYVEARVAQSLPIPPDIAPALEAMLMEHANAKDAPKIRRALALAQAASGDFRAAFDAAPALGKTEAEIWHILAVVGEDRAILDYAILAENRMHPDIAPETSEALARRLLKLGFAKDAALWLDKVADPDAVLAAEISLAQGDAQSALTWLVASTEQEADPLRAQALQALGDNIAAAKTYSDSGAEAKAVAALIRAGDWAHLAETGPAPWKAAAATVLPVWHPPPASDGPLARGHSLVDSSAKTRLAVASLLQNLANPAHP
jgi:hypothetical protein